MAKIMSPGAEKAIRRWGSREPDVTKTAREIGLVVMGGEDHPDAYRIGAKIARLFVHYQLARVHDIDNPIRQYSLTPLGIEIGQRAEEAFVKARVRPPRTVLPAIPDRFKPLDR